jgi:hypothetical protein
MTTPVTAQDPAVQGMPTQAAAPHTALPAGRHRTVPGQPQQHGGFPQQDGRLPQQDGRLPQQSCMRKKQE